MDWLTSTSPLRRHFQVKDLLQECWYATWSVPWWTHLLLPVSGEVFRLHLLCYSKLGCLRTYDKRYLRLEFTISLSVFISWGYRAFVMTAPSILFTSHFHLGGFLVVFLFHKFNHHLKPSLCRFLIQVLQSPLFVVSNPFLLDDWLPLLCVCQCVISLPKLKHFRLWFDLQDTMSSPVGSYIPGIIVEPPTDALC